MQQNEVAYIRQSSKVNHMVKLQTQSHTPGSHHGIFMTLCECTHMHVRDIVGDHKQATETLAGHAGARTHAGIARNTYVTSLCTECIPWAIAQ